MRDYKLYIEDILKAVKNIDQYTKNLTFTGFRKNNLVVDAVVRNLEIIGEAVKSIPLSIRKEYPQIEWKKISGLRDILAHEYFGVDVEIVWDIVKNKLPDLKKKVILLLPDFKKADL